MFATLQPFAWPSSKLSISEEPRRGISAEKRFALWRSMYRGERQPIHLKSQQEATVFTGKRDFDESSAMGYRALWMRRSHESN